MISRKPLVVLDLDGGSLTAIEAIVSAGRVTVQRCLSAVHDAQAPGGADDATAIGAWIRDVLKAGGIDASSAVLSMSRADVVLKRLVFPVSGDAVAGDELAGMVRLQMSRAMTLAVDGAAIDYVQSTPKAGDTTTMVLAGAIPAERLALWRQVAREAGLRVSRVTLRSSGAAAMMADVSHRRDGPVVGVCLGARSVEFVIVEDGQMAFARAAEFTRPDSGDQAAWDAYADRIAVELRRTWTSYRVSAPGSEAPTLAALGTGMASRLVGERCAKLLDCQVEVVGIPPSIDVSQCEPAQRDEAAFPLLGLLLEHAAAMPMLDFAHPRKAADRSARTRQRVLLGVLAVILLVGGAGVVAMMQLDSLKAQVAAARVKEAGLRSELDELTAQQARAGHLEQWTQARVDWLAHIEALSGRLPDPKACQLTELSGAMSTAVAFNGKAGEGGWNASQSGVFSISGKVKERDIAADLRKRLIDSKLYKQVETRGPEISDAFSFELVTTLKQPPEPQGDAPGAGVPDSKSESESEPQPGKTQTRGGGS